MHIDQVVLARTVWLVNLQLINPLGLAFRPISDAFKERYRFLNYPVNPSDFDASKGITYTAGEFQFEGNLIAVALTVYNDGWVADTSVSTEASEAFLYDLSGWLTSAYAIKDARELVTKIAYDSQFYVTSELSLLDASKKIRTFTELLREFTGNVTEEPWALLFEPDGAATSFSFERRVNTPFSKKQYYTKAALPTSKHVELLTQFERIFA